MTTFKMPEPTYLLRRKGLNDFVTCSKDRYIELSSITHLFEVKKLYTEQDVKQAMLELLEQAEKACALLGDCGPDNGCCPTYWNDALDKAQSEIRKLKEQL